MKWILYILAGLMFFFGFVFITESEEDSFKIFGGIFCGIAGSLITGTLILF